MTDISKEVKILRSFWSENQRYARNHFMVGDNHIRLNMDYWCLITEDSKHFHVDYTFYDEISFEGSESCWRHYECSSVPDWIARIVRKLVVLSI